MTEVATLESFIRLQRTEDADCVWLQHVSKPDHQIWVKVTEGTWMEISIRSESLPGLLVQTFNINEFQLMNYINDSYAQTHDWKVFRSSVPLRFNEVTRILFAV